MTHTLPLHFLIALVAGLLVFTLGILPSPKFQNTFARLSTRAEERDQAEISLTGMQWPKVGISVVTYEGGAYVRVTLHEKETEEAEESEDTEEEQVVLTVPAAWELQEVYGVQAHDLVQDVQNTRHRIAWTSNRKIVLLFRSSEYFKGLQFAHDSSFPALVQFSHATFPRKEIRRTTQFVAGARFFAF